MILADNDIKTLLDTVRRLYRESGLTLMDFSNDVGISTSTLSTINRYPDYLPGKHVMRQLRAYIKKVRQRCPAEATQK